MSQERSEFLRDYWTTEDLLDFDDFLPALETVIGESETPLTVGVFGSWGTGKTSLLQMLRHKFAARESEDFRTVWFTAWKYHHEEALWRAFVLRVVDALYPRVSGKKPYAERERVSEDKLSGRQKEWVKDLDRLQDSLYRPVDWKEFGRLTLDCKNALEAAGRGRLPQPNSPALFSRAQAWSPGPSARSWLGFATSPRRASRSVKEAPPPSRHSNVKFATTISTSLFRWSSLRFDSARPSAKS